MIEEPFLFLAPDNTIYFIDDEGYLSIIHKSQLKPIKAIYKTFLEAIEEPNDKHYFF